MAHEINRLLRAFAASPWFIEPRKADEIANMLVLRHELGVRSERYRDGAAPRPGTTESHGSIRVVRLYGPIIPRTVAIEDISAATASITDFVQAVRQADADPSVKTIVLDIDSPGGRVDLVPEAASVVAKAKKRTVAIANTLACSAAYWIGCQADEFVVTPSGEVGSIGVYTVHQDISGAMEDLGVKVTYLSAGPRKTEGNPFEPLGDEAKAHFLAGVQEFYGLFVKDVATGRRTSESVVRADPVKGKRHFGGGRSYGAKQALALGMVDKIESFDDLLDRLAAKSPGSRGNHAFAHGIELAPASAFRANSPDPEPKKDRTTAMWDKATAKVNARVPSQGGK